jgi:hypothetical protein
VVRVFGDVVKLISEIFFIAHAMGVEPGLPNLSGKLCANLEGETTLDALCAALDRLSFRGRQQYMKMFGHYRKPMKKVSLLLTIVKEN